MHLYKCPNESYKNLLANLLGWDGFCNCGFMKPYEHTHKLKNIGIWKDRCVCGGLYIFNCASFGKALGGSWIEIKNFKCRSCDKKLDVYNNLFLQSEVILEDGRPSETEKPQEDKKEEHIHINDKTTVTSIGDKTYMTHKLIYEEREVDGKCYHYFAVDGEAQCCTALLKADDAVEDLHNIGVVFRQLEDTERRLLGKPSRIQEEIKKIKEDSAIMDTLRNMLRKKLDIEEELIKATKNIHDYLIGK